MRIAFNLAIDKQKLTQYSSSGKVILLMIQLSFLNNKINHSSKYAMF